MFKAILYAYIIGGITFIPLVLAALIAFAVYTSVPVEVLEKSQPDLVEDDSATDAAQLPPPPSLVDSNDAPRPRKGWLTMRRTFEESTFDGGYVTLVRSFLDARSKDPKRSRPKDMWYVVLKGKVLYLYEDEGMTECEAAIQLGSHDITIYPDGLLDGELFTRRNAICLKPKPAQPAMPSITKEMKLEPIDVEGKLEESSLSPKKKEKERQFLTDLAAQQDAARAQAFNQDTPWFMFVRSAVEMEDWYLSLIHASDHSAQTPTLNPLQNVFLTSDMDKLVSTLDEQPDVIPMRWLNALFGRLFYSFYRTEVLESFIIGRLMKKLSKVKRPAFLADIIVTEVSVGNRTPTFSKPMLKELTKEGDASMEVHLQYKGEIRVTVEATAIINLGARFKSYTVKLVLAVVLKELEGNLLVKVKRPPSNRIWYAFTQPPKMVLEVQPIVSDRQITWGMILTTMEARLKEIIQESIVMPEMDDISFFESAGLQHRGGIWSDAGRRVGEHSIPMQEEGFDDTSTTMSAPPLDKAPLNEDLDITRSNSAQELDTQPSIEIPETISTALDDTASHATRRRSWVSSVRSDEFGALLANAVGDQDSTDSEVRGRTSQIGNEPSLRSLSSPHQNDEVNSTFADDADDEPEPLTRKSAPSSRRSSYKGHAPSSSFDESPFTSPSPKGSEFSLTGGPSSFLSTLKSRAAAADKQAISNTAKEAIRKWGVNWGGLKKESSDDSSDHIPRAGPPEQSNIAATRNRASYAEVRAAVAERKERERGDPLAVFQGRSASGTSSLMEPFSQQRNKRHSASSNSEVEEQLPRTRTRSLAAGEAEVPSTSSPAFKPIHVQPQAKTMAIPGIHASHRGEVMSMGYVAPQSPPSEPKNPVYRLWKSPKGPPEQVIKTAAVSETDTDTRSETRPSPPRLPTSRVASQASSDPSSSPSDISQLSATETLAAIVASDETARGNHVSTPLAQ